MSRKKEHTAFHYFIGSNSGTWVLILVHLMILVSLIMLFSAFIGRMQNY